MMHFTEEQRGSWTRTESFMAWVMVLVIWLIAGSLWLLELSG